MIRHYLAALFGILVMLVLAPAPAFADNCSSLADCYGTARSATTAAAGLSLLIGVSVLVAPTLLRRLDDWSSDDVRPSDDDRSSGEVGIPDLVDPPIHCGEKVLADMAMRGWSQDMVEEVVRSPYAVHAKKDTRYNGDGTRKNEAATAYVRADGWYVVLSDRLHDVVQVSSGTLDGWLSDRPLDPGWADTLPGRAAADAQVTVVYAGAQPCYPITEVGRVIDFYVINGIRILGVEGFVEGPVGLVPQLDMILDCSAKRSGPGPTQTNRDCAFQARQLANLWRRYGPPSLLSVTTAPVEPRPRN